MEWVKRFNESIDFIEENLDKDISFDELAKITNSSTYHYQRMFSYIANMTLSEYIRKRRMSKAAVDLKNSNEKIIDIGLKYSYSSPTAFNRAFQSIHGIPPSLAREDNIPLKAYPKIQFTVSIKGAEEMEYKIVEMESIRIIGISETLSNDIEENFKVVPKIWERVAKERVIEKLIPKMNKEPKGVLGVSASVGNNKWEYFIAVASDEEIDNDFKEYTIPPFTWAIFDGEGTMPQSIQDLEKRIVQEWLPTSGYEYGDGPDIEVYISPDPENAKFQVWIPVIKSN